MSAYTFSNDRKRQMLDRTGSYSTRPSRRGVNLLGWEEDENMSDEELRDCLVAKKKSVAKELERQPRGTIKRRELGLLMQKVNEEIHQLRPKKKAPGVERYFMEEVKQTVTKAHYNILMDKAVKKMKEDNQ